MRCAITSPIPGSASSSVEDAVLTLMSAAGVAPATAPDPGGGATGAATGTRIWTPSASGAARFSALSDAFGLAPPAARIASMTRSPSRNS
jgi:hypothetical protein